MTPKDPSLLGSMSSWVWAGHNDLTPAKRIWQRWWDGPSVIRLQKTVTSVLLADSLYCPCGLHSLRKKVAIVERSFVRRQILADSQWRAEALSYPSQRGTASCKWHERLASWSGRWPDPKQHFDWETLKLRTQLSHGQIPDPQKLWDDKHMLL